MRPRFFTSPMLTIPVTMEARMRGMISIFNREIKIFPRGATMTAFSPNRSPTKIPAAMPKRIWVWSLSLGPIYLLHLRLDRLPGAAATASSASSSETASTRTRGSGGGSQGCGGLSGEVIHGVA